jgi:hypothetical protein
MTLEAVPKSVRGLGDLLVALRLGLGSNAFRFGALSYCQMLVTEGIRRRFEFSSSQPQFRH